MPQLGFTGRFLCGFVLTAAVLTGVWFVVTGVSAGLAAQALHSSAGTVRSAAAAGDFAGAAAALPQAQDAAATLDARLTSAPWSWAQSLPVVGGSISTAAALASAADSVLAESNAVVTGLEDGDVSTLTAALQQHGEDLAGLAIAARLALADLSSTDDRNAMEPLRTGRQQVMRILQPVASGAEVAQVLPGMLGIGAPVKWLVVLGQPSEARGSGEGFYGAYLTVTVADGQFTLEKAAANGPETNVQQDLSHLPPPYRSLWGSDATYLWGYNLSRHYPYTAPVIWRALDPSAQYVVSLDPRVVAGLMTLTGPLTVDGITLDSSNAEEFFARDIYIRYPNSSEKDQVTLAFLSAVFGSLGSEPHQPAAMWKALGPAVGADRLQVWSPDPAVEAKLTDSPLGGAVEAMPGPWVTAAFNNSAGNKIDSFVESSLRYSASGSCASGVVQGSVNATLTLENLPPGLPGYISGRNDEPTAPYGTSSMLVHIYGPIGSIGRSMEVDGKPVFAVQGSELGHPVWGVKVQLAGGKPVHVRATFDQPAYPGQPLVVDPQPMVQDTTVSWVDERSCGVPVS